MRLMSLSEMLQTIRDRDPAARSNIEIMLTYPGLHALGLHRVASWLYHRNLRLPARIVSHTGRFLTGIEIHPGATIGKRFFIDHGMGVVIGETAVIGDDVTLYQSVTLGGTGKQTGKRHPTLGNGVVVGVGAKILGDVRIGDGAKIGGGSVVLKDVPANATAVGVPARTVVSNPATGQERRLERLPDPQQDTLLALVQRIESLETQVRELNAIKPSSDASAACR
jgi:serine O-acetyltransferase